MPFVGESFLISKKKNSNARMDRYTKTGSSRKAPFSRLKYFIVKTPFSIKHDFT